MSEAGNLARGKSLPPLVGPDGKKIAATEVLAPQRAGPTLAGVRNPIGGNPAAGLDPARMAQILRGAIEGNWENYLELAEQMEERDLHYQAVLSVRKRSVAQLPIAVEAASDDPAHVEHADFVRRWIKRGTLRKSLYDILDAVGKGFSVHEIEWETKPSHFWPAKLNYRKPSWFAPDDLDRDTPMLYELGSKEPLPSHRFIVHIHKSKSGAVIRSGIAFIAAWAWMMKRFTDHDWAVFCRNYGQPVRVGKYDGHATDEDRETLWRAVANIAGDMAAIIPASMSIEFITAQGAGANPELHQKRCEYLDQQVSKLVLGQTTSTDAISGGHAVSQEHREVAGDIERADALLLSSTLTELLVPWLISLNFGPQEDYPVIAIGRPDEVPLKDWIEAIKALAPLGLRVEASQIYDRLGIEEPAEDAETIGGAAAGPAQDPLAGLFSRLDVMSLFDQAAAARAAVPAPFDTLRKHLASQTDPDLVEALARRTAQDAAGALGGMTAEIRAVFDNASSLEDAKEQLDKLSLDPKAFAEAMARGIAIADLAGRAALLEDLERGDG